jgi:hypothetical protein
MTNNPYDYVGVNSGAHFDGSTYSPELDHKRLTGMLHRIYAVLSNGRWYTLRELSQLANGTEASISARLRDLRKVRFGSHTIDKKREANGLWRYKMEIDPQVEMRL